MDTTPKTRFVNGQIVKTDLTDANAFDDFKFGGGFLLAILGFVAVIIALVVAIFR